MRNKIYTIIDDNVEYKTKVTDTPHGTKYLMKTSNSETWRESARNAKIITALDDGNGLEINFKGLYDLYDRYDVMRYFSGNTEEIGTLRFNYAQIYELYCFLDLWHRNQRIFDSPTHFDTAALKKHFS